MADFGFDTTALNIANNIPKGTYGDIIKSMEELVYDKNPFEFSQSALGKKMDGMDSDVLNYYQAEMASYRDLLKWQATNEWNLEQWYRENKYNSPVEQVQRYMEAGINPLWAMNDTKPGQANQLQAQQPHPTQVSTATMDAERLANERSMFAQSNALQSVATMGDLSIKERALTNEIRKTDSDLKKVQAQTELLKSQLESNDWANKITAQTFDVQCNLKIEELNKVREEITYLRKQENLTDEQREYMIAQTEYEKVLKAYTEAMAKKVESETFDKLENLKQRWYALYSARIQANAAATSSAAQMQQAQTADAALNHQIEKDTQELKLKSNEQILSVMENCRSWIDKAIGNPANIGEEIFGGKGTRFQNAISMLQAGAKTLFDRFYSNPTKANADALDKTMRIIQQASSGNFDVQQLLPFSPGTSVQNPSQSWSH